MLDPERARRVRVLHDFEFERLSKAYQAGVMVAVPAALCHCREHGIAPPAWVIEAALQMLCDLLKREKSTNRGRSGGAIARYRQDKIDFIRWNEVFALREEQQRSLELMEKYPTCPSPSLDPIYAEEVAKAAWLGRSLSRLYACASEALEKTEAFGSPDSIKRSYLQVERSNRRSLQAYRYCLFHALFVRMLGFEDDLGYGRHAKVAPWRTSTLGPERRHKGRRKRGG
jgi:hypothetical protein